MTTSAAKTYKRELKKKLSRDTCSRHVQQRLLSKFSTMLETMGEEYPNPTIAQLEQAFGAPDHMARVLLEGIPAEDRLRRRDTFRALRTTGLILLAVMALGLVLAFAYSWYMKQFFINVGETLVVVK